MSGIISFAGSFFPEEESVHFPGRGLREGNCSCARLPLTNDPYHPGSAVLLPSQELGSFMKNKLIMHTKLHLQETFRCAWQSSKMIRFTFCSRRLVTPSSRRGLNGNVHPGGPCALLAALCGHGHGGAPGPGLPATWRTLQASSRGNRKPKETQLAHPRRKPEASVSSGHPRGLQRDPQVTRSAGAWGSTQRQLHPGHWAPREKAAFEVVGFFVCPFVCVVLFC